MKTMTSVDAWLAAAKNRIARRTANGRGVHGPLHGNAVADVKIYEDATATSNPDFDKAFKIPRGRPAVRLQLPPSPAGAQFQTACMTRSTRVLTGQQTPKQALDQAQKEAQSGDRRQQVVTRRVDARSTTPRAPTAPGPLARARRWALRFPRAGDLGGVPRSSRPWIFGFLIFTAGPMVSARPLVHRLQRHQRDARSVGLANYRQLSTTRGARRRCRTRSIYDRDVRAARTSIVALGLAMLLRASGDAAGFFRTIFYLPTMTPPVAVGDVLPAALQRQLRPGQRGARLVGITGPVLDDRPGWMKPSLVVMPLERRRRAIVILPRRAARACRSTSTRRRDGRRRRGGAASVTSRCR